MRILSVPLEKYFLGDKRVENGKYWLNRGAQEIHNSAGCARALFRICGRLWRIHNARNDIPARSGTARHCDRSPFRRTGDDDIRPQLSSADAPLSRTGRSIDLCAEEIRGGSWISGCMISLADVYCHSLGECHGHHSGRSLYAWRYPPVRFSLQHNRIRCVSGRSAAFRFFDPRLRRDMPLQQKAGRADADFLCIRTCHRSVCLLFLCTCPA